MGFRAEWPQSIPLFKEGLNRAIPSADKGLNHNPVVPGKPITYTIGVHNIGGGAGTVKVSDPLPTNLTYTTGTVHCVTTTGCAPLPAGDVTINDVADTNATAVPGTPPKVTELSEVNPVPVTVTTVPAANGPAAGAIDVTVGNPR